MYIVRTEDGGYAVQKQVKKTCYLDGNKIVTVQKPFVDTDTIYTADTKEEASNYIFKRLDETFRYSFLNLEKLDRTWKPGAFYRPISNDIVELIKSELGSPGVMREHGIYHKQYTYISLDEQEKHKNKYLNMFVERLWKAFNEYDNSGDVAYQGEKKVRVHQFSEENIEEYKNSRYYNAYKNSIKDVISKLMSELVREPIVVPEPIPPKNVKEAVNNLCYNMSHKEKKTAPTLASGWVVYLVIMFVEVLFVDTIGLWIPTTIIFIIWRAKQKRKYNWEMNEYDKKHYDPWKNNN